MEKIALVVLIVLVGWFALRIARFAMRLILFLILAVLLLIAYYRFKR
jgi:hypothetical protein